MALPPHALAAGSSLRSREDDPDASTDDSFEPPLLLAREVMRADGLNAFERREWDAALDENRSEEAAIFERAAARLRPSWVGPDEMLELGLANASPEAPSPIEVEVEVEVEAEVASLPAVSDEDRPASKESNTEGLSALAGLERRKASLRERALALIAQRRTRVIAVAALCFILGAAWAGFSGESRARSAAKPAVMASSAPAPIASLPSPAAETEATAHVAAPKASRPASKKPGARSASAKKLLTPGKAKVKAKAKAPPAKAAKPIAKKPIAKKPATARFAR